MRNTPPPRLVLASASPARLRTLMAAGIDADVLVSGFDESTVDAARPDVLCGTLARLKAQTVAARLRRTGRLVDDGSNSGDASSAGDGGNSSAGSGRRNDGGDGDPGTGGRAFGDRVLVLGCDSVLEFDGTIFGKPADAAEATERWRQMRGRAGVLYTGHCLVESGPGQQPTLADAIAQDTIAQDTIAQDRIAQDRIAEAVAATKVHFAALTDDEIDAYVTTGEPLRVAGAFTIDGLGGPFVERIDGDPGTVVGLSLPLLRRLLAELDVDITSLWRQPHHSQPDHSQPGHTAEPSR